MTYNFKNAIIKSATNKTNFIIGEIKPDKILDLEKKLFDLSNFKKDNYEFKDFATVTKSSLKIVEKAFKKKVTAPVARIEKKLKNLVMKNLKLFLNTVN